MICYCFTLFSNTNDRLNPSISVISFFNNIDFVKIQELMEILPWDNILYSTNTNASEQVDILNSNIISMLKLERQCSKVPIKKVTIKNKAPPWLTEDIRTAIRRLEQLTIS